ncbi:MAG: ribosome silencing factor [bacterium]
MTEDLKALVIDALEDIKAKDIVVMDVSELTDVTDTLIVASGASARQVKSLADHVVEKAKKAGHQPLGVEGLDSAEWVLVDFGSLVAHIMRPETRGFYELEKLWSVRPGDASAEQ